MEINRVADALSRCSSLWINAPLNYFFINIINFYFGFLRNSQLQIWGDVKEKRNPLVCFPIQRIDIKQHKFLRASTYFVMIAHSQVNTNSKVDRARDFYHNIKAHRQSTRKSVVKVIQRLLVFWVFFKKTIVSDIKYILI